MVAPWIVILAGAGVLTLVIGLLIWLTAVDEIETEDLR